jgi:PAS domain S-box-containing protein
MRSNAPEASSVEPDRFHRLIETVTDYAIFMLDANGVVTSWNSGAERLKGYTYEEAIGRHYRSFFSEKDRAERLPEQILALADATGRHESEGQRLRKDGSTFWALAVIYKMCDGDGRHTGFAKVTRDITERRAAQEALLESERRFRILVQGVTDYAIYMLDPNGIITNWNVGAERIKGYTADEIIGQHLSRFYTWDDRTAGVPARALRNTALEGRYEAEGWRVRKDGTRFWAAVVVDAIRDDRGKLIGFAKVTRHVTERREAQKRMEVAQAQLAQMQKMEALGQLTGGVAHDFNNLLMIISGFMPRMKILAGDDPKGRQAVGAIELAARRGATLTRQLLSFSRRQSLNPEVVQIGEIVEAAKPILASLTGGAIELLTTILPGVWAVRVDVSELELAIINLTVNARDAMKQGGIVSITAENVSLVRPETIDNLEGDFVAITVADTGEGIPPDILERVFDPFFTTKEPGKGTGLGLSQVHGFVHQSGGSVSIRSDLGQGTRITLYLPRATIEASTVETTGGQHAQVVLRRVLLVEDNPDVAEATRELLNDLDCEVETVGNAEAALLTLESGDFDLVLSDIVMAGAKNGLDLARAIRKQRPDLPIVLATGYSDAAMQAAAEFPILRKPYDVERLNRTLNEARRQQ